MNFPLILTVDASGFARAHAAELRRMADAIDPPTAAPPRPPEWVRWEEVMAAAERVAKEHHAEALASTGDERPKAHRRAAGAWSVHTEIATIRRAAAR